MSEGEGGSFVGTAEEKQRQKINKNTELGWGEMGARSRKWARGAGPTAEGRCIDYRPTNSLSNRNMNPK